MDIKEIQNLIKFVARSGASEVKLEMEDIKITIRTGSDSDTTIVHQVPATHMPQQVIAASTATTSEPAAAAPAAPASEDSKYITIKSPIIGTFYRKTISR